MSFTLSVLLFRQPDLLPEGMRLNVCCSFSPSHCLNRQQSSIALLRHSLLAMLWAVFVTLCRFFLSATEQFASQAVTRCVWCCGKRPPTASPPCASSLSTLENWSLCWVFLSTTVLLALKERSSNTDVPSNLKEDTCFTQSLWCEISSWVWFPLVLASLSPSL